MILQKDANLLFESPVLFLLSIYLYLYCSSKRLIHQPSAVPAIKRTGQASTPATPQSRVIGRNDHNR